MGPDYLTIDERAQILCPECFERHGWVPREGVIPPDHLVGLLTRCTLYGMQLWTLQALEREINGDFQMKSSIRERRSRPGRTKGQLAAKLGASTRVITLIENVIKRISADHYNLLREIGEELL